MCFTDNNLGMEINLTSLNEEDIVKILFSENSGIIFQSKLKLNEFFDKEKIFFHEIGKVINSHYLNIINYNDSYSLDISNYRDTWFSTSYHFDKIQTKNKLANKRFKNYKKQPLEFTFPKIFTGKILNNTKKINAAIIREKGSNSEREMAYMMSLSGFNVKDVHMTDIISGRENLKDISLLVAVGGFSNSDVLGSAKGWAGSFIYNKTAKQTLNDFFNRDDSMSLGVCNGCQLFIELGLINNDHDLKPKMEYNDSGKFECIFTSVKIQDSPSIMMKGMEGSNLGVWAAHGEGKFIFPYDESKYTIPAKYSYNEYPANPNGSNYNAAMLTSNDGKHLVMMPHLERSIYPHNWAYYPENRKDEVSPWVIAFNNAYDWLKNK
jgi:phosphoribosylformylglycinamidine synthase